MGEPNISRSFRFNLDLVLAEMWRWPRATAIGVIIVAGGSTAGHYFVDNLDATTTAICAVAYAAGALGLKTVFMLMINPVRRRAPFQGSYLVASFITMVPIFVFYSLGFRVLAAMPANREMMSNVPTLGILAFLALAYPVFSMFCAGFLHFSEAIQLQRLRG